MLQACFHERVKAYSTWQNAQQTLTKKREALVKIELAGKNEKLPQAQDEVKEVSEYLVQSQYNFVEVTISPLYSWVRVVS